MGRKSDPQEDTRGGAALSPFLSPVMCHHGTVCAHESSGIKRDHPPRRAAVGVDGDRRILQRAVSAFSAGAVSTLSYGTRYLAAVAKFFRPCLAPCAIARILARSCRAFCRKTGASSGPRGRA